MNDNSPSCVVGISDDVTKKILEALSNAGLCVCEKSLIEDHHPGLLNNIDYVMGRIEETN